jgi:two-component system sensor histidine kinase QseC
MRMARPSLRGSLLSGLLAATTLAWLGAALATYADLHRDVDRLLDEHLRHAARLLIAQSAHEILEIDPEDLDEPGPYSQVVAFQVWERASGQLLLRSPNAPAQRFSTAESGFSDARSAERYWRVFSGRDRDGLVLVQVAEDRAARAALIRRIAVDTLAPLAVLLPVLALLVYWLVGRATAPLARLGDEVAARGAGDLLPLSNPAVPVEALPLVERLDELFARAARQLDAERRFTSHAAHELRTPVAGLRAQAEVALAATEDAVRRAALERVIEGCERMSRLIDQLLALARLDDQAARGQFARVALDDIARSELARLAPAALAAGATLEFDGEPGACIAGDAALLAIAIGNLVTNALRHGGPAPAVRVLCQRLVDRVQLRVADDGPGVPADERAELGRRFFRGSGAAGGGAGLGLSIVARIAELHGGSLGFSAVTPGGGLIATLTFPVVPPDAD